MDFLGFYFACPVFDETSPSQAAQDDLKKKKKSEEPG